MSLVYNNDKPIGKCESYSIDKVPGTTPFVMLTNYEPLRSELNENQQVVLEWLKEAHQIGWHVLELFDTLLNRNYIGFDEKEHSKMDRARTAILVMGETEVFQLLAALAEWGKEKVAE